MTASLQQAVTPQRRKRIGTADNENMLGLNRDVALMLGLASVRWSGFVPGSLTHHRWRCSPPQALFAGIIGPQSSSRMTFPYISSEHHPILRTRLRV